MNKKILSIFVMIMALSLFGVSCSNSSDSTNPTVTPDPSIASASGLSVDNSSSGKGDSATPLEINNLNTSTAAGTEKTATSATIKGFNDNYVKANPKDADIAYTVKTVDVESASNSQEDAVKAKLKEGLFAATLDTAYNRIFIGFATTDTAAADAKALATAIGSSQNVVLKFTLEVSVPSSASTAEIKNAKYTASPVVVYVKITAA